MPRCCHCKALRVLGYCSLWTKTHTYSSFKFNLRSPPTPPLTQPKKLVMSYIIDTLLHVSTHWSFHASYWSILSLCYCLHSNQLPKNGMRLLPLSLKPKYSNTVARTQIKQRFRGSFILLPLPTTSLCLLFKRLVLFPADTCWNSVPGTDMWANASTYPYIFRYFLNTAYLCIWKQQNRGL